MSSSIMTEILKRPVSPEKELLSRSEDKNFLALETIDEQFAMLNSIPIEDQLDFTGEQYKDDKLYYMLLDLYLANDLDAIAAFLEEDPDFYKMEYILLTKRNLNWIPKIEEAINDESTFIAVGCAHLIGEKGVLALMRNKGYILTPIGL